jgi:xylulose-5-phosphate/fructose-6-phosphate phosphoketolase
MLMHLPERGGSTVNAKTGDTRRNARGYKQEGTIATPLDMTVLNDLDRLHLVMDTIDGLPQTERRTDQLVRPRVR